MNHQNIIESLEIKDMGLAQQLRKKKKENIDYFLNNFSILFYQPIYLLFKYVNNKLKYYKFL